MQSFTEPGHWIVLHLYDVSSFPLLNDAYTIVILVLDSAVKWGGMRMGKTGAAQYEDCLHSNMLWLEFIAPKGVEKPPQCTEYYLWVKYFN